jgi:hypothetical protein
VAGELGEAFLPGWILKTADWKRDLQIHEWKHVT